MKRTLSFNRKLIDKNLIKIEAEECELTHQPSVGKITYPVIKKVSVNSATFPSDSEILLRLVNKSESLRISFFNLIEFEI